MKRFLAHRIILSILLGLGISTASASDSAESTKPVDSNARTLKQVSGGTLVGVSTAYEGVNGIVKGPNVALNKKLIIENFNCIQPAVYPAWGGFWPAKQPPTIDGYSFFTEPLSSQAEWAKQHDLYVLHHVLLAPNYYYPEWWKTTEYSPDELEVILKNYVKSIVSTKNVDAWNLFNELFLGNGRYFGDWENNEWGNKWVGMGMEPDLSGLSGAEKVNKEHPRFIRIALETAAAHTEGKLELREGTTFKNPKKLDAMYQLALHLKNSGSPLDAVGVQAHLDWNGDYDFDLFKSQVERFRKAGLEFYVTELDAGLPKGPKGRKPKTAEADWETIEPMQAQVYYRFIKAAREAGVSLICVWGIADAPKGGWRGGERALLFKSNHARKPTYDAVLRALMETAQRTPNRKRGEQID